MFSAHRFLKKGRRHGRIAHVLSAGPKPRAPTHAPPAEERFEAKPLDDRPLNVIDAKEIVVKVLWGTGALMLCGGLGALSFGATKPAVGLLGFGSVLFAGSYALDWWT